MGTFIHMWKLIKMPLNNQQIKKNSNGKSKSILRQMKMETQCTKMYGIQQKQFLEENLL